MRLDLHVHTDYSNDSFITVADILREVPRKGLDGLAITDHNTIGGALEVQRVAPFRVIVGEEVKTSEGEIADLFLHREIPPGMSTEETIAVIREQGASSTCPTPSTACAVRR